MITREDLQTRHAQLVEARKQAAVEWHERDIGYAFALGELERLLALLGERQEQESSDDQVTV